MSMLHGGLFPLLAGVDIFDNPKQALKNIVDVSFS
jgi:hypothetical protein